VAWWIDADASEPNPALLKLLVVSGEADQLPIAIGSPVAAVEDEYQRSLSKFAAQVEGLSPLVW
jgi:hypothetical protein